MRRCLLFIMLFSGLLKASAQQVAIDGLMQYCQTHFHFNGVVLVADGSHIIYHRVFQKTNGANTDQLKPGTRFRLGSISKQFTAFVILQLIEKKELSFNDPLAKYIKIFDQPGKNRITIRNLLTHTSGLADYTELKDFNDQLLYHQDSIASMIAHSPLAFDPSTGYAYCNSNFFLLALIAERVTKKEFPALLQEMIFKKAGMQHSGEEEGPIKNEARGYLYRNDSMMAAPFIEMKNTKGGGGMYSTAEDLLKWSVFLQRTLAKDRLVKHALQPFTLADGTKTMYACGFCLMPGEIFHTGNINGFSNLIAIDTVHHLTIVLLTNDNYNKLYITMQSLQNILLHKASNEWLQNKPGNDLSGYKGVYSLGGLKVVITDTANYLEVEKFGQKDLARWFADDEFFSLGTGVPIKFERNKQGTVISFDVLDDYRWYHLKKEL